MWGVLADKATARELQKAANITTLRGSTPAVTDFEADLYIGEAQDHAVREGCSMTLEQACSPEYQGAQCAFKDSMIH